MSKRYDCSDCTGCVWKQSPREGGKGYCAAYDKPIPTSNNHKNPRK